MPRFSVQYLFWGVGLLGLLHTRRRLRAARGLQLDPFREAACPVIVLLHAPDPAFVKEASKRGVFAYISDADVED